MPGITRLIAVFLLTAVTVVSAAEDADSKPVLRRGIPANQEAREEPSAAGQNEPVWSEVVVSEDGKVIETTIPPPDLDPVLVKARTATERFAGELPDLTCQQLTDRYKSSSGGREWEFLDQITAEVLYVDGREEHSNIQRDGRPLSRDPSETAAWSTGGFGGVLLNMFEPTTHATFQEANDDEIFDVRARVFEFEVEKAYSRWTVNRGGRVLRPAYEGKIWVDPSSGRVLRIEMAATEIPDDYPLDVIEMTVDYGSVNIAGEEFLLATRSENLSCVRDTPTCDRNETEFKDYRHFTAESTFSTAEPTVPDGER